jgi:hypothetical protein
MNIIGKGIALVVSASADAIIIEAFRSTTQTLGVVALGVGAFCFTLIAIASAYAFFRDFLGLFGVDITGH